MSTTTIKETTIVISETSMRKIRRLIEMIKNYRSLLDQYEQKLIELGEIFDATEPEVMGSYFRPHLIYELQRIREMKSDEYQSRKDGVVQVSLYGHDAFPELAIPVSIHAEEPQQAKRQKLLVRIIQPETGLVVLCKDEDYLSPQEHMVGVAFVLGDNGITDAIYDFEAEGCGDVEMVDGLLVELEEKLQDKGRVDA